MSPNFFRFTIQKRNPFDSEIGNCIEKKSDSSPPRYYPSAFSAPSFLPENSILVVFVLLFLATVFPFPFPQLRPISENYTFSLPSPDLSLSTKKEEEKKKAREWTTYNRVIYFQPGVTSNRIVTRPIVNNTLKRTFDLSVAKRGKLARRRGPAAIALERPPLSQRLSQTAHNNESFTLEPIRSLLGVRWTTTTLRRAATFTSSRLTYYRRGR